MGGQGFGQGLMQGLQAGQQRLLEQQTLKIQQNFNKARLKQMESEDALKQLQLGSLQKKLAEEASLPGMQADFMQSIQGAPLHPNDFGPPNPVPEIDRSKLATLLQAAAHAGQDPDQLLGFMAIADPRIEAIKQSLQPKTLKEVKPGESLIQVGPQGETKNLFTNPSKPGNPPDFGDRLESAAASYGQMKYGQPTTFTQLLTLDPIQANALRQQAMVDEPAIIAAGKLRETIPEKNAELLTPAEANELGMPFGTTKGQAKGSMAITPHQREALAGYDTSRVIIADIKKYSEKVNTAQGGLLGTIQQGGKLWGAWTQSNPDAALLMSKAGELASVARSLGEKGALANQDVARAAALVPSVLDTGVVAQKKIQDMIKIIEDGEANYRKSLGVGGREPVKPGQAAPKQAAPTKPDPLAWITVPPGFTPEQAQKYKEAYNEQHEKVGREMLKGGKTSQQTKPSYQSGTSYVPQTGPATLHEGEMVIPKEQADKMRKTKQANPPLHMQVADLFASYIDQANDPKARGSLQDNKFFNKFNELLPPHIYGYTPNDFGVLQMNPQYRGIRMVLPQSGGSYGQVAPFTGALLAAQGAPRVMTQGPVGQPDPNDPHSNNIPLHPWNFPPDMGGLREQVYGELIRRGYPVFGGTGDFGGEFQPGFNPIGFGQR